MSSHRQTDSPTTRPPQRSAHVARRLLNEGVGKGTRVGLFFANGVDWIVWWLAVSRIGALAVPLSTLYAPAELAKVLRLADIGLLVAPHRVLDIDVAERFEAAMPELTTQSSSRLALRCGPLPASHRAHRRHGSALGDTVDRSTPMLLCRRTF